MSVHRDSDHYFHLSGFSTKVIWHIYGKNRPYFRYGIFMLTINPNSEGTIWGSEMDRLIHE